MPAHAPPDQHRDPQRAEQVLRDCVARALDGGAEEVETRFTTHSGLSVTVRHGAIETVEHQQGQALTVYVYRDQRRGSASTNDLSAQAIGDTVAAACTRARHTERDPHAGLADPRWFREVVPQLDLQHPWPIETASAAELARRCEAAALAVDARIDNSEGATVYTDSGLTAIANSHGFFGAYAGSRHGLSCSVIARAGGEMHAESWYDTARDPARLDTPERIGQRAGARAVARLGARQAPTASVPVLFEAPVAVSLFAHLMQAISGVAQYRGASFLLNARGREIAPHWLSLREEPHLPGGLGSAPFDVDGLLTRPRTLVADGRLESYKLSVYSARKLGLEPTGNAGAVHNLVVTNGAEDLHALIGSMRRGLLVTELLGFGVNLTTGDYSRGAAGYWIENGAIQYPVTEVTIAGNLRDMYPRIAAIGSDIEARGMIRTGSVLIDAMTVAGR